MILISGHSKKNNPQLYTHRHFN